MVRVVEMLDCGAVYLAFFHLALVARMVMVVVRILNTMAASVMVRKGLTMSENLKSLGIFKMLQLSKSSRSKNGGAYFSAVCGSNLVPVRGCS